MPITVSASDADRYSDEHHWEHVLDFFFTKAIEGAGYEPVRPATEGSDLIHSRIINQLIGADLVLVDLSSHNPNVFFELGVRTALNKPVALVADQHTSLPFDTAGINTLKYNSNLSYWNIDKEQEKLTQHIGKSAQSSNSINPLWRHFGMTMTASAPTSNESPEDVKLDLIMDTVNQIARQNYEREIPRTLDEARWAERHSASVRDRDAMPIPARALSPVAAYLEILDLLGVSSKIRIAPQGASVVQMDWESGTEMSEVRSLLELADENHVEVVLPEAKARALGRPTAREKSNAARHKYRRGPDGTYSRESL